MLLWSLVGMYCGTENTNVSTNYESGPEGAKKNNHVEGAIEKPLRPTEV